MRSSDVLDRFLLSGLSFGVGVATGLLLAPQTGRHARDRLARNAREAADAAQTGAADWAAPIADRARTAARQLGERHLPLRDDFDLIDEREILDELRRHQG